MPPARVLALGLTLWLAGAVQALPGAPGPYLTSFTPISQDTEHLVLCLPFNVMVRPASEQHPPGVWASLRPDQGGPVVGPGILPQSARLNTTVPVRTADVVQVLVYVPLKSRMSIINLGESCLYVYGKISAAYMRVFTAPNSGELHMANAQIASLNITSHTPSEVVLNGTFGDVTASVSGGNVIRIGLVEKRATVELGLGTYIAIDAASNDTVISGSAGTNAAAYYSQGSCELQSSGMASPSRDAFLLCQRSERFKNGDVDGGWTCGIARDAPLECCAQLGQHLKSKELDCARREKRQRSRSMICQVPNSVILFDPSFLG